MTHLIRLTPLLVALSAACASTAPSEAAAPAAQAAAPAPQEGSASKPAADEPDPAKKAAKAAYKKEDRAHELAMARVELELAELDAAAGVRKSEQAASDARRELEEAERALAVFVKLDAPRQLAEAQLGIDRADHRRDGQADELNELIAMYEAEDFAQMTKELVLKRGRKGLEFAERSLALEREKQALLIDETLPKKERELRVKIEQAQRAVAEAEVGLAKAALEAEKKRAGGRQKVEKLERPPLDEDDGDSGKRG